MGTVSLLSRFVAFDLCKNNELRRAVSLFSVLPGSSSVPEEKRDKRDTVPIKYLDVFASCR
jgi:hypothetical protein